MKKIIAAIIYIFSVITGFSQSVALPDSVGDGAGDKRNTFIGFAAGNSSEAGGLNFGKTFVGYLVGQSSAGGNNTFIGSSAGGFSDGERNTFLGVSSGSGVIGSFNTMLGGLTYNLEGNYNTILGYNNIGLSLENQLFIGNNLAPLVLGDFNTGALQLGNSFQIAEDGKVGIGTLSPNNLLEIQGDQDPSLNLFQNSSSTHLQVGIAGASGHFCPSAAAGDAIIRPSGGASLLFTLPYSLKDGTTSYFSFGSLDYERSLNIFQNGKVTIGTTDNTIDAKLAVEGKIVTNELHIKNPLVADFVFEEDYQLSSLDEVELFIRANGHLPGVPSGEKMLKDGVDMAEMNQVMLKKIEELTLYVIELKKESEQLKKLLEEK